MQHSSQNLYKKLLGAAGETQAVKYLQKQGCKIIKRNYTTPLGEADIVMQEGGDTVFVEVKTRTNDAFSTPGSAVDYKKQKRYRDIAKLYFLKMGEEVNVRFDVVEITQNGVNWIKNAF
ncbi:MAG: YraN family protein [Clostridia bacterium]|nr:YraN family protein [Clostridia bacterium]